MARLAVPEPAFKGLGGGTSEGHGLSRRSRLRAARAGRAQEAVRAGPGGSRAAWPRLPLSRAPAGLGAACARARARSATRPGPRGGARRVRGRRPAAGALTLLGLLLPRQRAAQLAQERLVLLHSVGPQGGRARRRGGHGARGVSGSRARAQRVWEPPWSPPPLAPGSGWEGAAPAPAPAPRPPLALRSPPPEVGAVSGSAVAASMPRAVGRSHGARHTHSQSEAVVPLPSAAAGTDRGLALPPFVLHV